MNKYVFFTCDIMPVGGLQLYVAGKTEYLEKNGWEVHVFSPGRVKGECAYHYLNKYISSVYPEIILPPADMPVRRRRKITENIIKAIGKSDLIYIESNNDISALWAELVASQIGAKHINYNCNEQFRGGNKYYEDYINFFKFKYDRNELIGLRPDTLTRLFEGYYFVPCDESLMFDAVEPDPIQDVENPIVSDIRKKEVNILYLGRAAKDYVPNIIEGVCKFALSYPQKSVQFIFVGDATCRKKMIESKIKDIKNLNVYFTGDLVPIPRVLYSKIDVVIAGAVCAEISAREGVPTIVADCSNFLANGILGYTVFNSMYAEEQTKQTDFCDALIDTLIHKSYMNRTYQFPQANSPDQIYQSQFGFFEKSLSEKKYYPVEGFPTKRKMKILKMYYYRFNAYFPRIGSVLRRIGKIVVET